MFVRISKEELSEAESSFELDKYSRYTQIADLSLRLFGQGHGWGHLFYLKEYFHKGTGSDLYVIGLSQTDMIGHALLDYYLMGRKDRKILENR